MRRAEKGAGARGADGFEAFYSGRFGGRWEALRGALLGPSDSREFDAGGGRPYFLDGASVLCAATLPLCGAGEILDVCAAPGGKSVVLAARMDAESRLFANERSPDRRRRLADSLSGCLPGGISSRTEVWGRDGARLCLDGANSARFGAILLDAPCSSERHVLSSPRFLSEWSPSRVRSLAAAQWALLSSAWRMLRPGGHLLYSTCALASEENDAQVSRLLAKFPDAEPVPRPTACDVSAFCAGPLPTPERTEFGSLVLPDAAGGAGPLYFALVRKSEGA